MSSTAFANPANLVGLENAKEQEAKYTTDDIQLSLLSFSSESKRISIEEAEREVEAKITALNNDSKEKVLCLREARHVVERLSRFDDIVYEVAFSFIGKMPRRWRKFIPVYKCELNIKVSESKELILKRTFVNNELYEDYEKTCDQERNILMSNSSVLAVKTIGTAVLVDGGSLANASPVGDRCKYTVYQVID